MIKYYQLRLRGEVVGLGNFSNIWCFFHGNGYELTLIYGNGHNALFYNLRIVKQIEIDFLSVSNPLKNFTRFVNGLEEWFEMSFEVYILRILGEFAMVEV